MRKESAHAIESYRDLVHNKPFSKTTSFRISNEARINSSRSVNMQNRFRKKGPSLA